MIGPIQQALWEFKTQGCGCAPVDRQEVASGVLNWQIAWLSTL